MTKTRPSTSYEAVHLRLVRERGKAREHVCAVAGCGKQACDWAWMHTGPTRTGEVDRARRTWGTDTKNYEPMCRHHHLLLDRGGSLTHCRAGHDREKAGVRGRTCVECARMRQRQARRRSVADPEPMFERVGEGWVLT